MNEVFIFKTSVDTPAHVERVASLFRSIDAIRQWSFDLEDCDRILRVVALDFEPEAVVQLLMTAGISCEHMEYEL
ncbi:hypothetical protein JHJ32_10655 [Parapedobacter sp. ISTM3]|uniref:Uncharacterized protein n=1 Tax=Parapedobacter luteus TaxID=623280 RepID=A0A1T5B2B6_9SPHI|nr:MULTISPECIES: hypothetical protein [Parapedobacter]MBK1440446.1 hypothetical protein [Parapedobacter sp. ISTM3]SKB41197.1 hypothetical protein SAMN05660226_01271 [Parapedobacter luteus]